MYIEELERLNEFRKKGIISQAEFDAQKSKILKQSDEEKIRDKNITNNSQQQNKKKMAQQAYQKTESTLSWIIPFDTIIAGVLNTIFATTIFGVIGMGLCFADRQGLKKRGIEISGWRCLLAPTYLYKRAILLKEPMTKFWTWFVALFAAIVFMLAMESAGIGVSAPDCNAGETTKVLREIFQEQQITIKKIGNIYGLPGGDSKNKLCSADITYTSMFDNGTERIKYKSMVVKDSSGSYRHYVEVVGE